MDFGGPLPAGHLRLPRARRQFPELHKFYFGYAGYFVRSLVLV